MNIIDSKEILSQFYLDVTKSITSEREATNINVKTIVSTYDSSCIQHPYKCLSSTKIKNAKHTHGIMARDDQGSSRRDSHNITSPKSTWLHSYLLCPLTIQPRNLHPSSRLTPCPISIFHGAG